MKIKYEEMIINYEKTILYIQEAIEFIKLSKYEPQTVNTLCDKIISKINELDCSYDKTRKE